MLYCPNPCIDFYQIFGICLSLVKLELRLGFGHHLTTFPVATLFLFFFLFFFFGGGGGGTCNCVGDVESKPLNRFLPSFQDMYIQSGIAILYII